MRSIKQRTLLKSMLFLMASSLYFQSASAQLNQTKPGTRWWWLGSAVNEQDLRWNLQEYAKHGIGLIEITPIYGVKGLDAQEIPYLSDRWMEMLRVVMDEAKKQNIEVDMATGTGWPFGGPWVPLKESACKAFFVDTIVTNKQVKNFKPQLPQGQNKHTELASVDYFPINGTNETRIIATFIKYGIMKVKRAAPGGEGWVIDHFRQDAVAHYLQHIEQAFERTNTPYPHTFFNDSYEVSEGNWTPILFDEFEKRRGYSLHDSMDKLLDGDEQVVADYRETLGDLLLENFTRQWTAWAHSHGAITRNQAHGSPANLIDCYGAVDIPEIEGFGLTDFGIKGLRTDAGKTRKNDSDLSMLKYAGSAAHITGKNLVSSETFTWLTEHFRTSLSQLKPDMDLMFCAGVNHMNFHGTCYSPKDDIWPGWKFYASIDMSPTNSIWRDAPYFMQYVQRCQKYLQQGKPDNDFLIFLPVKDLWHKDTKHLLMQFSIHKMGQLAPEFIKDIAAIDSLGYDCDYISEQYLLSTKFQDGKLVTAAGTTYKGLILPGDNLMSPALKQHIYKLKKRGAPIVTGIIPEQMAMMAQAEKMKTELHLNMIRRKDENGYHYFIANLTPNDISETTTTSVDLKEAIWYNPLTDSYQQAITKDGQLQIDLKSGESRILLTSSADIDKTITKPQEATLVSSYNLSGLPCQLSFVESRPTTENCYQLDSIKPWESLDNTTATLMGTGCYELTLNLSKKQAKQGAHWKMDLGDVRESARIYINNQLVGCAWAAPFEISFDNMLHEGTNKIRIEVTNLPANQIAQLDREGYQWRKFKEINVVDINYKKTTYADWQPMPSGLNSIVMLYQYR